MGLKTKNSGSPSHLSLFVLLCLAFVLLLDKVLKFLKLSLPLLFHSVLSYCFMMMNKPNMTFLPTQMNYWQFKMISTLSHSQSWKYLGGFSGCGPLLWLTILSPVLDSIITKSDKWVTDHLGLNSVVLINSVFIHSSIYLFIYLCLYIS